MNDVRSEFARLERGGCLGDPAGQDAYAYLRASSERQVEDGSSFPRQLESVHLAAARNQLRIAFDLIFFGDGYSGFEFEHRPALTRLRDEVRTKSRAAHLVVEDIDRLSRHADWQQGFLLEEFARHGMQVHFHISPGSQLERYVRGYIAQEGMKKDLERMRQGALHKARDGKVTAKRPRYGYQKTDPHDTHYVLHPEESPVMRAVFSKLIYDSWTLHQVAAWLNERQTPTRFKTGFWTAATLHQLVKSPVYKGTFYANRHYQIRTGEYNANGKPKKANRLRPEAEWIPVEVPAIVTPAEWQLAQEVMTRNAKRSDRNGRQRGWLLQSYLKCAACREYAFVAVVGGTPKTQLRYYGCNSRGSEKARMLKQACHTPYVKADDLERRVWEEIETIIYDPSAILRRLEDQQAEARAAAHDEQLVYLDSQLGGVSRQRAKLEAAYNADIYTLPEFQVKMQDLRAQTETLEVSRAKIVARQAEIHALEDKKRVVLRALARIRVEVERAKQARRQPEDLPLELKRKFLALLVDVIWVNSVTGVFTVEGEIKGTFALDGDDPGEEPGGTGGTGEGDFGLVLSRRSPRCATCRCVEKPC